MFKKISLLLFLPLVLAASIYFSITTDIFKKQNFAGLQIEYPQGKAAVFINDQYLGQAPLFEEKIQSGEVIIKIVPDKEELATLSIPLSLERKTLSVIVYNPGKNPQNSSSIIFELKKLKGNKTSLSFESYPEDALVSIDEMEAQKTPLEIENLTKGDHHFAVKLMNYHSKEHSFKILEGYQTKITVNLAKNYDQETKTLEETTEIIETEDNVIEASNSSSITGPKVEILSTNFFIENEEVLRVRNASASSSQELGFVKTGYFYPYLNQKSSDQEWLKINFENQDGWISAQFAQILE